MKLTFTKDYHPTEEVVRNAIAEVGLTAPDTLEVTGSVIEMTYDVAITDEEKAALKEVVAQLGYFLNI
jgi:hypothetical protein